MRMRFTTAAIAGFLSAAGGFAVWAGVADSYFRQGDPENVERAVRWWPRNAAYLELRALQMEYDGGNSTSLLERAAALHPMSSAPRIRLGLAAELRGDLQVAEKELVEAVHIDRQFEPRWTLANFYFRNARIEDFWKQIRAALEISYGDRRPIFDLCRSAGDARMMLDRALPDRGEVIANYLRYLYDRRELDVVAEAAKRLAKLNDPLYRSALLDAAEVLVGNNRISGAAEVWDGIGNPEFDPDVRSIEERGFNWHRIRSPGVNFVALDDALRIQFNGEQNESGVLLRLPVNRGSRYSLRWMARMAGMGSPTGLEWKIGAQSSPIPPSDDWRAGQVSVTVPGDSGWLELAYTRPPGQKRTDGRVEIRQVEIVRQ